MLNALEEIFFWSGIMRDHGEFMLLSLSYKETGFIKAANDFKTAFESLRREAEGFTGAQALPYTQDLVSRAMSLLLCFINFKRVILRRLLECNIEISQPPTIINHMINEAMEFYRTLCMLQANVVFSPTSENIQLHNIWLPDAAGHAASIAADLDPVEALFIEEANEFKKIFDGLSIKAKELGQMLERACLCDTSLSGLNEEAKKKILEFICFLEKVEKSRMQCKILGIIKPLIPNHMIREETYYLSRVEKLGIK